MRVEGQAFWRAKAGMRSDEYEDAYGLCSLTTAHSAETGRAEVLRAAVADGATESSFSQSWARILVRAYCRGNLKPAALADGLRRPQALWARLVNRRPLPWYAEEKRRVGAFAAFVGISISQPRRRQTEPGSWSAWAVGDCCLFQVRADRLLRRFPLRHSADFNSRPVLLPSVSAWNASIDGAVRTTTGSWRAGDQLYLVSDALAACLLAETESRRRPWRRLAALSGDADSGGLDDWVDSLRASGALRNDDVTLVTLTAR